MKIFLIRHGETFANIKADTYFNDRVPDHLVTLTDNGLQQADMAGNWLKDYCEQNAITLDNARIWRSPYYPPTSKKFTIGYRRLSLVRESDVVKCQSTPFCAELRMVCQTDNSSFKEIIEGIRLPKRH